MKTFSDEPKRVDYADGTDCDILKAGAAHNDGKRTDRSTDDNVTTSSKPSSSKSSDY